MPLSQAALLAAEAAHNERQTMAWQARAVNLGMASDSKKADKILKELEA